MLALSVRWVVAGGLLFIEDKSMPKPRLRLREFLLVTTLISLIAAGFAIRARTASLVSSAPDPAYRAYLERRSANWYEGQLREAKRKLELVPRLAPDQFAEYDVRLMRSVINSGELPTTGKHLVIVGHTPGGIYFRIFDGNGGVVVDWAEGLQTRIGLIEGQLAILDPPHELTTGEKNWVVTTVMSLVDGYRDSLQVHIRIAQASHAEAVASAEYHERLAQRP
jgi:hypothetical protein